MSQYRNKQQTLIATTDSQLLGPNPNRHSLLISSGLSNRFTISFGDAAVLDKDITIYPGQAPLILRYDDFGGAITEEIRAISAGAAQFVSVVEMFCKQGEQRANRQY